MSRLVLKLLNGAYDLVVGTLIFSTVLFSAYSIWDNAQVYRSAAGVQDSIRQYRPVEEGGKVLGFDDLREINKDVIAWLTMEGTNIDYPVLQGKDNLEYMNKDVYGDVSLAGSIFLDTRCGADFEDRYSLIYGHNMDQHLMFGDLALYKDKQFFAKHKTGELITPKGKQKYKVVAVLQISAGEEKIFNPTVWKDGFEHFADYLKQSSIWYRSKLLELMKRKPQGVQVAALVTCSSGSTNDRTVLILMRERPDWYKSSSGGDDDSGSSKISSDGDKTSSTSTDDSDIHGRSSGSGSGPKPTGDGQDPVFWYRLIGGIVAFIALFEALDRTLRRRREEL